MLLQPKSVGPLTIQRKLGSDGVSDLYEGVLSVDSVRAVRIRRLHDWVTSDPPLLRAVESRIGDLLALRHPRLVRVLDYIAVQDERYMVEEVVDGIDLLTLVERLREAAIPMPSHVFVHLSLQLCTSVEALHNRRGSVTRERSVLHRAVRPRCVQLGLDGSIRLGGYGLLPSPNLIPRSARRGPVSSRTAFLAPEQVEDVNENTETSGATDIFSLGASMYTMLTGGILFDAASDLQAIHLIRRGEIDDELAVTRRILSGIDRVLERCLAVQPGLRYQSVHALRTALRGLGVQHDASRTTEDVLDLLSAVGLAPPSRTSMDPVMHYAPEPAPAAPGDEEVVDDISDEPTLQDAAPLQYDFVEDVDTHPGEKTSTSSDSGSEFAQALMGADPLDLSEDDLEAFHDDIPPVRTTAGTARDTPAPLPVNTRPSFGHEERTARSIPATPEVTQRDLSDAPENTHPGSSPRTHPGASPHTQPSIDLTPGLDAVPPPPPPLIRPADLDEEDLETVVATRIDGDDSIISFGVLLRAGLAVGLAFAGGGMIALNQPKAPGVTPPELAAASGHEMRAQLTPSTPGPAPAVVAAPPAVVELPDLPSEPAPTEPEPSEAEPTEVVPDEVSTQAVETPPTEQAPEPVREQPPAPPASKPVAATLPPATTPPVAAPVATPMATPPSEPVVAVIETPEDPKVSTEDPKVGTEGAWVAPVRLRDADAMGARASRGHLSSTDRRTLEAFSSTHADFARARMWLYEDATQRGDLSARRTHIKQLVSVAPYNSNPVFLFEAAEVAFASGDWRGTVTYGRRMDRLWTRLPASQANTKKSKLYEMEAMSWQKLYARSGDTDDDSRRQAITAWERLRTHAGAGSSLASKADAAIATLSSNN